MRNYLNVLPIIGKEYNTGRGIKVKVIKKHNDYNYEVALISASTLYCKDTNTWVPYTNLGNNYIVNNKGHFGYCYNNPMSLLIS